MTFSDAVALVTGAGSGIGAAVSQQLASAGVKVVASDIDYESAVRVAERITQAGGVASPFALDTTSPEANQLAVDFAITSYGRLTHAVNNAGIGKKTVPIGAYDLEDWRRVIDVDLNGVFYGLRAQLPAIELSGYGAIVNMASIAGISGVTNNAAYVASKHAVVGLTKAAALEYGSKGIRVNAVGPGFVETPILANMPEQLLGGLSARHALGRLGTADEIASLTVFLLSDEASFLTGSLHLADGGYSAGFVDKVR